MLYSNKLLVGASVLYQIFVWGAKKSMCCILFWHEQQSVVNGLQLGMLLYYTYIHVINGELTLAFNRITLQTLISSLFVLKV